MVTITVDDVSRVAVRAWTDNTSRLLRKLDTNAEKVPFKLPSEVVQEMRSLVDDWSAAAAHDDDDGDDPGGAGGWFQWEAEVDVASVERLLLYWFNITQLTDADRQRLDIEFAPEAARPFADALAAAVGAAVASEPSLAAFVSRLAERWAACQPAFSEAVALSADVDA